MAPLSYRDVPALLLGCLAFSSAFYGVYAFLADHVRRLLALSAGQVGFIAFAYGAGFMLSGLLGARLIERLGPRRALPLALGAAALVYLALLPAARALPAVLLIAAVWGAASQLCLNLLVLLLSRARPEERGAVLGLNTCVTYLGASLGTAVAGTLYPCRLRHAGPVGQRRRRGRRAGIALAPERAARRAFKAAPKPAPAPDAPSLQAPPSSGAFSSRSAMLPLRAAP